MEKWNYYDVHMTAKREPNRKYVCHIEGRTLEEAIEHHNYWEEENQHIGKDFEITSSELVSTIWEENPYKAEMLMRKAMEDKVGTIRKIMDYNFYYEEDRIDLIAVIATGEPYRFTMLDTAVRDDFINIMENN